VKPSDTNTDLPEGSSDVLGGSRSRRAALTLFALLPLTTLLAWRLGAVTHDPWLDLYGLGVLTLTITIIGIAFAFYVDPADTPATDTTVWTASCLLAVHNDVAIIERCIRSLIESDYEPKEIIVVDDASTDGTAELLAQLEAKGGFRLVALPKNVGKKRALVEGAAFASGDLIVFTDSDCVVAPDAIRRCARALQSHPNLGAVSGHARALNADQNLLTRVQDVWYDGQFGVYKAAEAVFGSVTCVSGPLAVFRRAAIWNYLPAWANDRFLGAEFKFATDRQLTGYALGQRWVGRALKHRYAYASFVADEDYPEREWDVGYVKSARVWTNVPSTFRSMCKQQTRWKKSFIRNLFFTAGFYWRRDLRAAALFYLHAALVILAPVMAFRHLVWLPLHGQWNLTVLYLLGVTLKGSVWGLAYRAQNRGDHRWVYRPLMSLLSATCLAWLLPYSAVTLRRSVWSRG
jgi:cellulose synthase/poly-beta-1,6-N-acetylglucosamine synthase-like glycosyltransferase